ncbi:MAG: DNA polymerase III subunit gamma/tau [Holosporales bacterium]|jgi:DNA polymerase-3 subunit gamma/tau|nr:DNA polymerase III subunit gamma/tau [Holosporales bacterium]
MAYIVLSRKYRPHRLEDLIGQQVLFETLKNCIDSSKIPHAFIFHGIRGIGKTTVARIIARCLNCDTGITSSPCGECKSCRAMDIDNHLDVMEIDAASRTGVDDIRDIIDSSQYAPVTGRFKIFIIDEVHMLSKSAFNALLKTLEEPPDHVKFIFATTEINKVPDTVISRCMMFNLRPVSKETIMEHVKKISEFENVTIDNEAAELIATEAEGSVRDSLSILQQAMMLAIDKPSITREIVTEMIGGAKNSDIEELLNLILSAKTKESLEKSDNLLKNGADPYMIYKNLQGFLYKMIATKVIDKNSISYDLSNLLYIWQIFLKQCSLIKITEYPEQVLNAAIVIMSHTASFPSIESLMIKDTNEESKDDNTSSSNVDNKQVLSSIKPNVNNNNNKSKIIEDILGRFPGSIVSEIE